MKRIISTLSVLVLLSGSALGSSRSWISKKQVLRLSEKYLRLGDRIRAAADAALQLGYDEASNGIRPQSYALPNALRIDIQITFINDKSIDALDN